MVAFGCLCKNVNMRALGYAMLAYASFSSLYCPSALLLIVETIADSIGFNTGKDDPHHPGRSQVFRGYTRPEGRPTSPDRVIGQGPAPLSAWRRGSPSPAACRPTARPPCRPRRPASAPWAPRQVPVHFAMVSPPRAPVRRYVPQDFGEQIAPWIGKSQSQARGVDLWEAFRHLF